MSTDHDAAADAHTVEEVIRHRLSTALGGLRGSLETTLPMVAFVVVWMWWDDPRVALVSAAVLTVAFGVVRVVQRQTVQYVISSVVATAIAAFFALRSGNAEDAFLPGILASIGWGLAALASVVLRWPMIGFMVGAADPAAREDPFRWRRDPGIVRVCQRLTLVLVALYVVRVVVMLPLYLAGNVALLSVAKVALGWPAWAAALALMGWMLLRGSTPQQVAAVAHEIEPEHEHGAAPDTGADAGAHSSRGRRIR